MENPHIRAALSKPGGIASRLGAARTRANLKGKELAIRLGWTASRVSKLESAQQMPTAEDVHVWMRACGAPSDLIRDVQADLEEIRLAYPDLQRARHLAGPDRTALDEAYRRGYAEALRDVQARVDALASNLLASTLPNRQMEER